jgi:hypothetical protein
MVFTDATGDDANNNSNLDLVSVTIDNDATNLSIAVTVANLHSDWGKHMIFFDTGAAGHTGISNPWSRNVNHDGNAISHFVGSWLDGGAGAVLHAYNDGVGDPWNLGGPVGKSVDWGNHTFTYTMALDSLGVSLGQTIRLDIASTGGAPNDPATDLFSSGQHGSWGGGSNLGPDLLEYYVVPAPGTIALLGFAGIFARRRRA